MDVTEKDPRNWTESDIISLNERLEKVGLPKLIVSNGKVYKDDLHLLLGIGLPLKKEE